MKNKEGTMNIQVRKAERKQKKLKLNLAAVSGAGKTFTSLALARGLVGEQGKILLVDTENSSSEMYADRFNFDIANLTDTSVKSYLEYIRYGETNGYDVVILDSLSHAWQSLLDEVDAEQKRNRGGNSFAAWRNVTPIYRQLVDGIVRANVHIISTMRAKSDYVMEEYTDASGKKRTMPRKVGLAPIFREGGEYEFDVVATLDLDHNLIVEKSRIDWLADAVLNKPGLELGQKLGQWLGSAKAEERPAPAPAAAAAVKREETDAEKLTRDALAAGAAFRYSLPADWTKAQCAEALRFGREKYGVVHVEGRVLASAADVPEWSEYRAKESSDEDPEWLKDSAVTTVV